jgi:hypothetical protein
MKHLRWCLRIVLSLACLQKAFSGPTKRKAEDSSEEWADYTLAFAPDMKFLLQHPRKALTKPRKLELP